MELIVPILHGVGGDSCDGGRSQASGEATAGAEDAEGGGSTTTTAGVEVRWRRTRRFLASTVWSGCSLTKRKRRGTEWGI